MADANAIEVATDHIGKVKAVIAPEIPRATRPYSSPINPDTVMSIFFRKERIIKSAIIKILIISAIPYQIAETSDKYDNSRIAIKAETENSTVLQNATIHILKVLRSTK